MNRIDHLGEKILWVLEKNGRLGIEAIAIVLNEKTRAVAASCVCLHRYGRARPVQTGERVIKNGKKVIAVLWEIGDSENRPPMPNWGGGDNKGKRHNISNVTIGIDDDDLAWMQRYRQQRQQRQQWMNDNARLRL